jgi:hypothetical protein
MVSDRNGVPLMEAERRPDDEVQKHFPRKAFAVHLLEDPVGSVLPVQGSVLICSWRPLGRHLVWL